MTDLGRPRTTDDGAELTVPNAAKNVAAIRRFAIARCVLLGWAHAKDTVALLVSEVATNAVLHVGGNEVRLRVTERTGRLRVEVDDASPDVPRARAADEAAEHGRGLAMVRSLAHSTGYEKRPGGKTFWFELEA